MFYSSDTIAAISTAHGTGGIGIVRISGENSFDIAERIFKGKKSFRDMRSHSISYGKIINPKDGKALDEVMITKMRGPNTFTRENIVEINCHGSGIVLKGILELVLHEGARLAEPGEFTKRAFLSGRIDLSQAEAVIDIINSKTEAGSKAAVDQLEGRLSQKLTPAREKLIGVIAHIEATIDYPEYDIEEITCRKVYAEALEVKEMLVDIIKDFERGRILREGISAAIVGRPNVGKSSLFNELSGKNRAIVTDVPGTTRDIIEEYINMGGISLRLMDTAGIRETDDIVEKIGVERAEKIINSAELVIVVVDASTGLGDEDVEIIKMVSQKKVLIIANKIDIASSSHVVDDMKKKIKDKKIIEASIKNNIGIDVLENQIIEMFFEGGLNSENDVIITNLRHKNLVDKAIQSINEACEACENDMPLDCVTIDIRNSAEFLGEITGESIKEDVMNEIFKKFCIGK
ncbi:tRNA modification GTPase trmE [Anaerobacterium chartisolvens]|uniref:tRNA modification GTPase MnmE n=1 Tax=Anaerobacterium chartisolvens TaxID=1297424 RepID=A0A369B3I0_9FIRM|nr:tRNA uridine-5-carboxymethylaminomethyl(34) synthesis GTPase MnmE [Anaerobacterium chartisolvens]RCX16140.1 tRNA modification GTPase trmE [Anaerobacterium chartisolvens]